MRARPGLRSAGAATGAWARCLSVRRAWKWTGPDARPDFAALNPTPIHLYCCIHSLIAAYTPDPHPRSCCMPSRATCSRWTSSMLTRQTATATAARKRGAAHRAPLRSAASPPRRCVQRSALAGDRGAVGKQGKQPQARASRPRYGAGVVRPPGRSLFVWAQGAERRRWQPPVYLWLSLSLLVQARQPLGRASCLPALAASQLRGALDFW